METHRLRAPRLPMLVFLLALVGHPICLLRAQQSGPLPASDARRGTDGKESEQSAPTQATMEDVLSALGEMRQELTTSRQQVEELKKEVSDLRAEIAGGSSSATSVEALKAATDQLRDDQEVTQSEVKTLQQIKVETGSKYPLSVNGMILFNSFVVDGAVDNPVLPLIALPRTDNYSHHTLGASLSQTLLGLSATGPHLWNARTSANLSIDFFNWNYQSITASTSNTPHLRSADVAIDWTKTRVTVGLEVPMISLLSPTSYATVSEPSLAWSGNLWTWLPQLTLERTFQMPRSSHALLGFGLLDPTTSDVTDEQAYHILRRSLQPGYEGRAAWQWGDTEHPYEIGVNGYYTRQLYFGHQALDFWAGTADWRVPLGKVAELSGEFYRGRGLGDLGGGVFKNIVTTYGENYGSALDATGGWAQLKARLNNVTEANAFFGQDSGEAGELRMEVPGDNFPPYAYLEKNRTVGANVIFRPKTYLVFSGEYRNLRSWYLNGNSYPAQNMTLTMGYLF
jgi:hypothetical protein